MEMCPACGKISNMVSSASMRTRTDSSGEKKWIKTISFHCEQCHQFVRSEDREEAALPKIRHTGRRICDTVLKSVIKVEVAVRCGRFPEGGFK